MISRRPGRPAEEKSKNSKIKKYTRTLQKKYLKNEGTGYKKRMCQHMQENSPHLMAHPFFTLSLDFFFPKRTFDSVAPETGNFGGGWGDQNWGCRAN